MSLLGHAPCCAQVLFPALPEGGTECILLHRLEIRVRRSAGAGTFFTGSTRRVQQQLLVAELEALLPCPIYPIPLNP